MKAHARAIATAGYIDPATTTGAIGPRWPPYTIAATPLAPNTPANMLQRKDGPLANIRCRVTTATAPASTNAVARWATTGHVPASSDVFTANRYMRAKKSPDKRPSTTGNGTLPAAVEPATEPCSDWAVRGGRENEVRNSELIPITMPSHPSTPGPLPLTASNSTGSDEEITEAIGPVTPMLASV
jgi:hypothetical protein